MRLFKANGKGANFHQVKGNIFVLNADKELSQEYVHMFFKHNKAAINLGYVNINNIDESISRMVTELPKYIAKLQKIVDGAPDLIDNILKMEYQYVSNFIDVTENDYNLKQIAHREFKTREFTYIQEKKRLAEIQKAKEAEQARLDEISNIKYRIKNKICISGTELLIVANDLNINIPLRTKGLIKQCLKINIEEISYPKGDTKKDLTNVFKWIQEIYKVL